MFVPPNWLNTCWLSSNARLSTRNRSSRVHSDSQSGALFRDSQLDLPGAGGILAAKKGRQSGPSLKESTCGTEDHNPALLAI